MMSYPARSDQYIQHRHMLAKGLVPQQISVKWGLQCAPGLRPTDFCWAPPVCWEGNAYHKQMAPTKMLQ